MFGESLRKQAEAVCKDLAVETGSLVLEDFGALPFVVAARIEAVLKKAQDEAGSILDKARRVSERDLAYARQEAEEIRAQHREKVRPGVADHPRNASALSSPRVETARPIPGEMRGFPCPIRAG